MVFVVLAVTNRLLRYPGNTNTQVIGRKRINSRGRVKAWPLNGGQRPQTVIHALHTQQYMQIYWRQICHSLGIFLSFGPFSPSREISINGLCWSPAWGRGLNGGSRVAYRGMPLLAKCICPNFLMYLSKLQIHICSNCRIYLFKL